MLGDFWERHGAKVALLLGVVLGLLATRVGAFGDDFLRHLVLEGRLPDVQMGPFTLYDFSRGDNIPWLTQAGYLPWQTHEQFSIRFFRPLSSGSLALDAALFGRSPLAAALINVLWFVPLLLTTLAIHRRVLARRRAHLATLLYAVAGLHAVNLAWGASRHLLVGSALAALFVLLYLRRRLPLPSDRWTVAVWLPPAVLTLGLFASESALAGLALVIGFELTRRDPFKRRSMELLPTLGVAFVYLVAYVAAGYGTQHSRLYVSPFSQPLAFIAETATRLPALLAELVSVIPAALWGIAPESRPMLVVLAVLGCTLIVWLFLRAPLPEAERRTLAGLALGTLLSCLPFVGGVIDGRMLVLPLIGSSALIASVIHACWRAERQRRLLRSLAALGLFVHLGLSPLVRIVISLNLAKISNAQKHLVEAADLSACAPGSTALWVNASDPSASLSGLPSLMYYRPAALRQLKTSYMLSLAPQDIALTGEEDAQFVLETLGDERRTTIFELLFNDEPIVAGRSYQAGELRAHVLEAPQGLPTRVRFHPPQNSCFVELHQGRLVSSAMLGKGERRSVPFEPGPMGL